MSEDTEQDGTQPQAAPSATKRRRRQSRATSAATPAGGNDRAGPAKWAALLGWATKLRPGRGRDAAAAPASATQQRRRRRASWTPRQVRLFASGCAAALVLGSLALAWQAGALDRAFAAAQQRVLAASAEAGLAVEQVLVSGRDETARADLRKRLDAAPGSPLLAFDPTAARQRLLALPWIREADVAVELPDTIRLDLVERQPVARWRHDGETRIVDDQGDVVATAEASAFADLPAVTGPAAAEAAPKLVRLLAERPSLAEAVRYGERVSQRRWDLHLPRDVVLRLPADAPGAALDRFLAMEAEHELTERAVEAIDLRLEDRLVVRLSRQAAEYYGEDGLIHQGADSP